MTGFFRFLTRDGMQLDINIAQVRQVEYTPKRADDCTDFSIVWVIYIDGSKIHIDNADADRFMQEWGSAK